MKKQKPKTWRRWAAITETGELVYVFGAQVGKLHALGIRAPREKIVRVVVNVEAKKP